MAETDIFKRWADSEFLRAVAPALAAVFSERSANTPIDIRGVIVGLDGALPQLLDADFQNLKGSQIDASYCKVSCSFSRAQIEKSRFDDGLFDTCRFKESVFVQTSFATAKLNSPTLDDATFRECSFHESQITGRGSREYGGRRMVFEKCSFQNARIRNLQLRACLFRDCIWDGVVFEKCIMVGVRFEGTQPPSASFVACGK